MTTSAVASSLTTLPGISAAIADVNLRLRELAVAEGAVFLTGEAGTEKAFAAKILHSLGPRSNRPLAKVSVSWKLPPDMRERFLSLDGGTLIVNLMKGLPVDLQYTMLELANDSAFTDPLSGDQVEADVRVIVLSGCDFHTLRSSGPLLPELSEILFARHVEIPPIRTRTEDIPALVRYATARAHETGRSKAKGADAQVLALFRSWSWPGNAEDLLLVTAEAALNAQAELIELDDLPKEFVDHIPPELVEAARAVRLPRSVPAPVPVRPPTAMPTPAAQTPPSEPLEIPVSAPGAQVAEEFYSDRTEETRVDPVVAAASAAPSAEAPAIERDVQKLERLLILAKRLHAQSAILNAQMSGPDKARGLDTRSLLEEGDVGSAVSEALEAQIQNSLDAILRARRQVSVLNERERNAYLTARDLFRRMLMSKAQSADAEMVVESRELTDQLRKVEESVARLFTTMTGDPSATLPVSQVAEDIAREEADAIKEAYLRASRDE